MAAPYSPSPCSPPATGATTYNTANLTPEDWARSISQREFTQA